WRKWSATADGFASMRASRTGCRGRCLIPAGCGRSVGRASATSRWGWRKRTPGIGSMLQQRTSAMYERLYRSLYRIRRVEEEIARVYPSDCIKSPVHLSIGQEAVAVGVCAALEPGDVVFGTYRGHALYLAKGGDLKAMLAELYGKATGCARGKGGS